VTVAYIAAEAIAERYRWTDAADVEAMNERLERLVATVAPNDE
jgi:hypothetical protein